MIRTIGTILICLAILGVIGPIASCWLASEIAASLGSHLTTCGPEIVMYHGFDIGGILWDMSMMPMLLFFTVPVCFILFLVGLVLRGYE